VSAAPGAARDWWSIATAPARGERPAREGRDVALHHEPPASALARGPAKTADIQRIRRELRGAELCEARRLQAAAARHRREAGRAERAVR
jgi:hypothetical protein